MNDDQKSATTEAGISPRRERVAWCLFDFANSAFPTIALTAFGGAYFTSVLVGDGGLDLLGFQLDPSTAWGLAISVSMALVTLTAPVMGAIADRSGRKRPFLAAYVLVCVAATYGLSLVPPGAGATAFVLYVLANFAFEGAYVFYNAFLPDLTTKERLGRLSGTAWALGYAGGLLALVLCLGLIPKDYSAAHAGRASAIYAIVATWYLVFSIPALLFLRDRGAPKAERASRSYVRQALVELRQTLTHIGRYRMVVVFLIAYFLYNDGITTVIAFTSVYTNEVLAFTPGENITLFIVMNVVAAPGALFFGWLLDRVGGKRAIEWSLLVWIAVVIGAVIATSKAMFWPVAFLAAVVIGATQASSRALMARLSPRHRVGEFMGFLALSGKGSAIVGPLLYGSVAQAAEGAGGHRFAIGAIGGLFVVAFFVMRRLDETRGVRDAEREAKLEGST